MPVTFGAIAKAKPSSARKEYPVMPDPDGSVKELVDLLLAESKEMEVLEGSIAIKKSELKSKVTPFFYKNANGKAAVESSVLCRGTPAANGDNVEASVSFSKALKVGDAEAVKKLMVKMFGEEKGLATYSQSFSDSFEIKISGDKVPASKAQEIVNELGALFTKHGCVEALTAKPLVKPVESFDQNRHTMFTLDQNLALEELAPSVSAVGTKARRSKKD